MNIICYSLCSAQQVSAAIRNYRGISGEPSENYRSPGASIAAANIFRNRTVVAMCNDKYGVYMQRRSCCELDALFARPSAKVPDPSRKLGLLRH